MSSAFSESEAALISSLGAQRDVEQYTVMVRELEKLLPLSAAYKDKAQGNDADEFLRLVLPPEFCCLPCWTAEAAWGLYET